MQSYAWKFHQDIKRAWVSGHVSVNGFLGTGNLKFSWNLASFFEICGENDRQPIKTI
jgi:hypothetical protein